MDLARVPDLNGSHQPIHQPLAMCRYLARELGLAGVDEWEAMYIDSTVDSLCVFHAYMMKVLSMNEASLRRESRNELLNRVLPVYLQCLEQQVEKNNGYCIGGKISWADIFFAVMFEQLEQVVTIELLKVLPLLMILLKKVLTIPTLESWKRNRSSSDSTLVQLYKI